MRPLWRRLFAGFGVLVIVLGGAGYLWLRSSMPETTGRLALPGLEAEVRITRDAHGLPTIVAQNDHDADFALGFLHAQDRLFAMDLMRHAGAGRLSEWFGDRTLDFDRLMRTLGLYRSAERQYQALSPTVRGAVDAYAAGVNAFLTTRRGALPPEYYVLGIRPEPWRPTDSLVWGKLMDLQLSGNYRGELLRARMLAHLTPADLAILYPPYPKDAPLPVPKIQALYRALPLDRLYALLPPAVGPERASNNWVLSGARTVSGKPLLANDPHLDFSAPSIWYLVCIKTPGHELAGVTTPGTPFVIIGHNRHVAWGFTTTGADVEDLFIEKPDPTDPHRYLAPNGALPFTMRQETIRVRNAAPVSLTVRATRHGPVISDLAGLGGGDILALEATWLTDDDRTPQALWNMDHAQDWASFKAATADFVAPQQNIVYADIDGHIGFIAPARVPIRKKGDGWLPVPGWSGDYDWIGTVPFAALPSAYDPPGGRIVTANNKIVGDDYPYFLTRDWERPERAERITALLDQTQRQSPQTTAVIQGDDLSLDAQRLLPVMLAMTPSDPGLAPALQRLRGWDAHMDRGKVEPLLFTAWLRALNREVLAARLGPSFESYWNLHPEVMTLILTQHQVWCAEPQAPKVNTCGDALAAALHGALDGLSRRYGSDMSSWTWGAAHPAVFANALWSKIPLLKDWLDLSLPADGGDDTVDAGVMQISDGAAPFRDRHGPTLRMIVDMAEPAAARFMISPGQSGNPFSSHWGDLLQSWRDVTYLNFTADASGGVLTLAPR